MTSVTIVKARRFQVTLSLPDVGRRRLIGTGSLCATATTLWLGAPAYLPGADVSALMVVSGFGVPWGVGWVTLLLMERRIRRDLGPADRRELPEHDRAGAR